MVCSLESVRMAASVRPQAVGSASKTVTGELCCQKLGGQYTRRDLHDADEENLLDEEDMHIFGLRPMVDPLDLVCCKACKKPIKTSQYNAHAELCKSLSSKGGIIPEIFDPALKKKPPRKQRKKLPIVHTNNAAALGEKKNLKAVESYHIDSSVDGQIQVTSLANSSMGAPILMTSLADSSVDGQIQMTALAEAKRDAHLYGVQKLNGPRIGPYDIECSENVTLHSSKSFKRKVSENATKTCTESPDTRTAKVVPYLPAPLATKIYYSQRNHHLRRAICHMFYEEPTKDSSNDASPSEVLQVNTVPAQTSSPSNLNHVRGVHQQFSQLTQKLNQLHAPRSESYLGKSGGFALSMNTASELPVNNTLGLHIMSKTHSFAGKAENRLGTENCLSTVQQGEGRVPVV